MSGRTRSLTTKTIRIYKGATSLLMTSLILGMAYFRLEHGSFIGLLMLIPYLYFLYRIWNNMKLLKEVSYNNHSLFVKQKEFEIEIPLYRIKDVELISLDGIYKFKLHDVDQFGDTVYCKPSAWYPFTYRKVDDELRELRKMIDIEKEKYWNARLSESESALPSVKI